MQYPGEEGADDLHITFSRAVELYDSSVRVEIILTTSRFASLQVLTPKVLLLEKWLTNSWYYKNVGVYTTDAAGTVAPPHLRGTR
jgi:hypothetical protein